MNQGLDERQQTLFSPTQNLSYEKMGRVLIKKLLWREKRVQRIDLRGLESNCSGIVLPPFCSSAGKLLIDTHVLRPPIPGAHPSVRLLVAREAGEKTQFFSIRKLMPNPRVRFRLLTQ